jgi:RimJ/RimL family protein N-acetyltransferase
MEASIAYSLLPPYRHTGLMTLSLRWVMAELIISWKLRAITAQCWADNGASISLLKKLGFSAEAIQGESLVNHRFEAPIPIKA